jgi:hypothetical protein
VYALYKVWSRIHIYVVKTSDDDGHVIVRLPGDILIDTLEEPTDLAIMGFMPQSEQFFLLVADRRKNSVWKIECTVCTEGTRNQHPVEWLSGLKNVLTLAVVEANFRVCVTTTETVEIYNFLGAHLYSVTMPYGISMPTHSLVAQDSLRKDYLIVSHAESSGDMKHRICLLSKKGIMDQVQIDNERAEIAVYGSQRGHRLRDELNGPCYLAIDESRRVFVADHCNNRVLVLDCRLGSSMIIGDNYPHPCRLWYDAISRYLIIGTSLDGIRVVKNATEFVIH